MTVAIVVLLAIVAVFLIDRFLKGTVDAEREAARLRDQDRGWN